MQRSMIVEAAIYLRAPNHPAFRKYRESFVSVANHTALLSEDEFAELVATSRRSPGEVNRALIRERNNLR